MKKELIVIALIAAIQPIMWWFIYTGLYKHSVKSASEEALGFACGICAVSIMAFCMAFIKYIEDNKDKNHHT